MNSIRCRQCKHFIIANVGEGKIYGCDRSKCVFEQTTKIDCDNADCNNCINHKYCDYEPTTKNNLGVDCISRQALLNTTVKKNSIWNKITDSEGNNLETIISNLPSVTPQLSVPEVTALAEWTAKLTKASEDAYNKGYADGVKSVNICPHCGEYIGEEE